MNSEIVVVAHNIRSNYNIGSLLRTCDGLGVNKVYLTGYSPYPKTKSDNRLPHVIEKTNKAIRKTALGAEDSVNWCFKSSVELVLEKLKNNGFILAGLEQTKDSIHINDYLPPNKIAVLLGSEVDGIDKHLLKTMDVHLEIPMFGDKESFNVTTAAAIALYHLRFYN